MRFSFALAALVPLLPLVFAGPAFDTNPQYPCTVTPGDYGANTIYWPELEIPATYDVGTGIFSAKKNIKLAGEWVWFDLAINLANQAQIYIMNGKGKSLHWRVTYKNGNNDIVNSFLITANSPSCKSTMQVSTKDVKKVFIELQRDSAP
jgi:hypothetical protein